MISEAKVNETQETLAKGKWNTNPLKQTHSKLDRQSAVLGTLLTGVVDYNKDKMLDYTNSSRIENSNSVRSRSVHAENGRLVRELERNGCRQGERGQRSPRKSSWEEIQMEPLVHGGFGDGYLPSIISPFDPQLEAELTENFEKEMEKYGRKHGKSKTRKCKWSYTEAFKSLQDFLASDDSNEKVSMNPVNAEQIAVEKVQESVNDCRENYADEDMDALVESVSKLLDQIDLKYSTVMINSRQHGDKDTVDTAMNVSRSGKRTESKPREKPEFFEGGEMMREYKSNRLITGDVVSDTQHESSRKKSKKKEMTSKKKPNNVKPFQIGGTLIEQNNEIKKSDVKRENHANVFSSNAKRECLESLRDTNHEQSTSAYPYNQWEAVANKRDKGENDQEQYIGKDRAKLLKELQECDQRLNELDNADAVDEYSDETSKESDTESSESVESSEASDGEESEDYCEEKDSVEDDYQRDAIVSAYHTQDGYCNLYNQHGAYGCYEKTGYQYDHHGNQVNGDGHSQLGGPFRSYDWFKSWAPQSYWQNPYFQQPVTGDSYITYLKQCLQSAMQTAQYYRDMVNYYEQGENLKENYIVQREYIDKMLRES